MVVVLVVFVVDFFLVDYDKDYESDNEGLKKTSAGLSLESGTGK